MSKVTENYEQLAIATGLHADDKMIFGERNGYSVLIYAANESYPYLLTVSTSVMPSTGIFLGKDDKKQFAKDNKNVISLNQQGNVVTMVIKNTPKLEKLKEVLNEALNNMVSFLMSKSHESCCQSCSQKIATQPYMIGNSYMLLCPECADKVRQDANILSQQNQQKKENVVGGIVGALIGSVIGILCILFFSQLGRIAAISGVVMAVCTLKGYEMLGGKLTKKGMVISILLMLIMTYIGDRIDWAILIVREVGADWDIDFVTAFQIIPDFLAEGVLDTGSYWGNLALLYIFSVLGAFPTVKAVLSNQKNAGVVRQLGTPKQS